MKRLRETITVQALFFVVMFVSFSASLQAQSKEEIKRRKTELSYFKKIQRDKKLDCDTQKKYLEFINDDSLLYCVVTNPLRFCIETDAVLKMKDQALLIKIGLDENLSFKLRENAARNINDEYVLFQIVQQFTKQIRGNPTDPDYIYRLSRYEVQNIYMVSSSYMDLIIRINDSELLFKLLENNKIYRENRLKIIDKISDPEIVKKIFDSSISNIDVLEKQMALKKIVDQNFLYQIASREDEEDSLYILTIDMLNDEMLRKFVTDTDIESTKKRRVIEKIKDQQFLYDLFNTSQEKLLRQEVIDRLTDQDLLLSIAQSDNDWDLRKKAFNKLDTATLEKVAAGESKDKALNVAAKIILKQTDWDKEFSNHTSDYLGRVIGAAALVENPKPTAKSVVSACHTYIRRGDKSRIPELRDLLLRYGDKALAEDYLNCGNEQLENAGREWGRKNGYNVGSGYGSNRVRWGSGR